MTAPEEGAGVPGVTVSLTLEREPHGHGLSFRRGIAEGLVGDADTPLMLGGETLEESCPRTHRASFARGRAVGERLRRDIAAVVK